MWAWSWSYGLAKVHVHGRGVGLRRAYTTSLKLIVLEHDSEDFGRTNWISLTKIQYGRVLIRHLKEMRERLYQFLDVVIADVSKNGKSESLVYEHKPLPVIFQSLVTTVVFTPCNYAI